MDVYVVVCFLFLSKRTMAYQFNETKTEMSLPYHFVAAILEKSSYQLVTLGVVLSHHWVLSIAHVFPPDWNGLPFNNYVIVAGPPFKLFEPSFALTHPAFTWGLYTAEDLALFYVDDVIETLPVLVSAGRFPWNKADCDFIYWSSNATGPFGGKGALKSFKTDVMVVQNCLMKKQKKPIGLLQFYMNDILCGRAGQKRPHDCVGQTGGILYCENLLVGLLIRKEWCKNKTANFTDIGSYANWLQSRVTGGQFIRLFVTQMSTRVSPSRVVLTIICVGLAERLHLRLLLF